MNHSDTMPKPLEFDRFRHYAFFRKIVQQAVGLLPCHQPCIGILLCKSKNKVVAEYALGGKEQLIDIAEYQLVAFLPKELEANLPSVEQIERELEGGQA